MNDFMYITCFQVGSRASRMPADPSEPFDGRAVAIRVPRWHSSVLSANRSAHRLPFRRRQMKVRPLQDRVLVRRVAEEEKTKGGIIIPDSAKEKPAEGEVVAVGSGKTDDKGILRPLAVKKGDRVLFGKYSGSDIKIDGVDHLI